MSSTQVSQVNRQVIFASRPRGEPVEQNFKLLESTLPIANDGQLLLKTLFLSLDPYMRGRLNEQGSYAEGVKLGDVMIGETISLVCVGESKLPLLMKLDRSSRASMRTSNLVNSS